MYFAKRFEQNDKATLHALIPWRFYSEQMTQQAGNLDAAPISVGLDHQRHKYGSWYCQVRPDNALWRGCRSAHAGIVEHHGSDVV